MWRNYVICLLAGLLIATSLSSLVLLRQTQTSQGDVNNLRQRAVAAEATRSSLQQQADERSTAAPTSPPGNSIVTAGATPTPAPVAVAPAPAAPTRQPVAVPTLAVTSSDNPILQQIEDRAAGLELAHHSAVAHLEKQAIEGSQPDTPLAAIQQRGNPGGGETERRIGGYGLESEAVELGQAFIGADQQVTPRVLRDGGHIAVGQTLFHLPVLFVVLRYTESGVEGQAGAPQEEANEYRTESLPDYHGG